MYSEFKQERACISMEFSVLMSVYHKDNAQYFDEAIESVLLNQSMVPSELIIVKDGPLTDELEKVINKYLEIFSEKIIILPLEYNVGLGEALKIGLENCNYEIVARMDADDINNYFRFEKQLNKLKENPDVHLIGTNIGEFFKDINNIKFIRKVPTTISEISKMAKRRNPINHVSVLFKKSAVLSSGGYKNLLFLEDYYLWIRMLNHDLKLININETLVYVRTGEAMFKRRSNMTYVASWFKLQKIMVNTKFINRIDLFVNMVNIVGFTLTPPKVKKYVYKWFLRKKVLEQN